MSRFGNLELGGNHEDHSQAFDRAPLQGESHFLNAAHTAFAHGNFESALRLYAKVLEFNPRNPAAWTGQVRMLIELDECSEARLWADKALEMFPNEPELLAAKAVALARSHDLQGALAFSDAAIHERGDSPYVWLARGDVLLARKEARANYCFEKALGGAPHDWLLPWLVGRIRFYYRQFALALKSIQQALAANPSHFVLWLELGRCQQALGLIDPARHSFTQAEQLEPHHPEISRARRDLANVGGFARVRGWWRRLFSP